MEHEEIEIDDIEAFIEDLKRSFDSLDKINMYQGFQMQLAKAISSLRLKKVSKIETEPKFNKPVDIKEYLLKELEILKKRLESDDIKSLRKFKLVMEIAKLREKINQL